MKVTGFSLFVMLIVFTVFPAFSQFSLDSNVVWSQTIGRVNNIDISPDSKYIALAMEDITSGEDEGVVKIFNLKTGILFKKLKCNNGRVWSVKYSDDGKYLICGGTDWVEFEGKDGLITIWDLSTWDTTKTIRLKMFDGTLYSTLSHDNKYLAYTLAEKGIEIIDFNTGKMFKKYLPLPANYYDRQMPNYLDFSKDDRFLAISAQFNPGRVIDILNDTNYIIDDCKGSSYAVSISSDGTKFVSYCEDFAPNGGANIIDINTKAFIGKISTSLRIENISISPNNRFISLGGFSPLSIWDINNASLIATANYYCEHVKFSPDSNYLISFTSNRLTLINLNKITSISENSVKNIIQNIITKVIPNPVNSELLVEFNISNPQKIRLTVNDIVGKEMSLLADEFYKLGIHQIKWNTSSLPNGEYFVNLTSNASLDVKKVIINR